MNSMPSETDRPPDASSLRRLIGLGALAWMAVISFDFFLHRGVLARLYAEPSEFQLRRVPAAVLQIGENSNIVTPEFFNGWADEFLSARIQKQ